MEKINALTVFEHSPNLESKKSFSLGQMGYLKEQFTHALYMCTVATAVCLKQPYED